jgi:hypothetical protein
MFNFRFLKEGVEEFFILELSEILAPPLFHGGGWEGVRLKLRRR